MALNIIISYKENMYHIIVQVSIDEIKLDTSVLYNIIYYLSTISTLMIEGDATD